MLWSETFLSRLKDTHNTFVRKGNITPKGTFKLHIFTSSHFPVGQERLFTEITLCLYLPSGPPSAPENPISTVNETCVTLEWSPPRDTGGRGDITYSLHCRKCSGDSKKCAPCGSSVHFVPRQFGLSSATVLVTDLQPDSNYSFTVESQNGVSDLSPTPRGTVVINITTSQTGERSSVC